MSLYYEDEFVRLHHGDCLEVTEWRAADVLVTDPPYGRAWRTGAFNGAPAHKGISNDEDLTTRDAALVLWGGRPAVVFGSPLSPAPVGTRQMLVYQKPSDAGIFGSVGTFRRDWEAIYLTGSWPRSVAAQTSVIKTRASSLISLLADRYPNDRGTGHPHTKPLDVMETLTAATSGVIADPFAGSGSTLVAAKALGRRSIGVEIEERYCEIAARRLAQDAFDFGGVA